MFISKNREKTGRGMLCRAVSILLSAAMVFTVLPPAGRAVYASKEQTGLCRHHAEHTEECGYAEAGKCTHEHTDKCYRTVTECVDTHAKERLPESGEAKESVSGNKTVSAGAEPESGSHICSEESGCITKILDCGHEHKADGGESGSGRDEDCGYREAQPCTYDCRLCPVEDAVGRLPEKVTPDNADAVREQLDEILDLFAGLTEDEQEQLDLSLCCSLQEQLDATGAPAPSANVASDLDFSGGGDSGNLETDGYHWNGNTKTLELKDVNISGTVTLPDDTVTIITTGNCSINRLTIANGTYYTHLTFSGEGVLTIQEQINLSGGDGLTLTVNEKAQVVAEGGINIGASGGVSSTVTVSGILTAKGDTPFESNGTTQYNNAISAGKVVVGATGVLNVSGKNGVALNGKDYNFTDAFVIEKDDSGKGGCFNADCENFNIKVNSPSGSFPEGSHADQAFNIPENYLPTDCEVGKPANGVVNLVKKGTDEVYAGPLTIHENHDWSEEWKKDAAGHWHECKFKGCGRRKDEAPHRFDAGTGKCSACEAVLSVALDGAEGLIYNGQEQKPSAVVEVDGLKLEASKYDTAYQNNINAGEASVTVTGKDGPVFEQTVKFQIARAVPAVAWADASQTVTYSGSQAVITPPAVTLVNGEPFSGSFLYSHAADGSSDYASGLPVGAGTYTVRASVAEQGNYSAAESANTLKLTVEKAENAPNMPSGTMNVAWKCKKVGSAELPAGWQWQAEDENTALEVGVPLPATAVYTGADKDNYKNVTAAVTITRLVCDHKNTEIRNEAAASCTEEGYSGDTFCADCDTKISSGAAVPATGHQWRLTGRKEATASSEGKRYYTCSRCGAARSETIPRLSQSSSSHAHRYSVDEATGATCTADGVITYSCSCGKSYREGIPALGHNYTSSVTREPTVSAEGVMTWTCSRCGDSYTEPIGRLKGTPAAPVSRPQSGEQSVKNDSGGEERGIVEEEADKETDGSKEESIVTADGDDFDPAPADSAETETGDQDLQSKKQRIPWWLLLLILLLLLAAAVWFFVAGRKKKEEESEEDE